MRHGSAAWSDGRESARRGARRMPRTRVPRALCRLPQTHVQGAGALRNTAATRPCMAAGHDMTRCPSRRTADELEKACGTSDGRYRKGRTVPGGRAACDRQWHHACHPRARAGGPDGFSNSPRVSWRAQNPLQKSCVGWFVPLIRLPLARIASRWHEPSPCTRYRYSSGSHRNRDLPQFAWTRSITLRGHHGGGVPVLAPGRVLAWSCGNFTRHFPFTPD